MGKTVGRARDGAMEQAGTGFVRPGQAGVSPNTKGSVFRREGEYWTIIYRSTVLRLRDVKGLRYLAALLAHPGKRFAADDLMAAMGVGYEVSGPRAGPTPDPSAPLPTPDEHARLAVTKRIKSAVRKIDAHHPALGYHFRASIKTGYTCVYLPDPERPISWTT